MAILVDRELQNLVDPAQAQPPFAPPLPPPLATLVSRDFGRWNTQIQPASLDLTIGRILLPPDDKSSDTRVIAEWNFALGEGKTAIIETREELGSANTGGNWFSSIISFTGRPTDDKSRTYRSRISRQVKIYCD